MGFFLYERKRLWAERLITAVHKHQLCMLECAKFIWAQRERHLGCKQPISNWVYKTKAIPVIESLSCFDTNRHELENAGEKKKKNPCQQYVCVLLAGR